MKKRIALTGCLTVFWVFIRGPSVNKLFGELLIGVLLSALISFSLKDMYSGKIDLLHYITVFPVITRYLIDFSGEMLKANLDVAKRVVHPETPISPQVLEIPLKVESSVAITTLANSITLTPGTLTMDYSSEKNCLYIHAINGDDDEEEIRETIDHWEEMLVKIFDSNSSTEVEKVESRK